MVDRIHCLAEACFWKLVARFGASYFGRACNWLFAARRELSRAEADRRFIQYFIAVAHFISRTLGFLDSAVLNCQIRDNPRLALRLVLPPSCLPQFHQGISEVF